MAGRQLHLHALNLMVTSHSSFNTPFGVAYWAPDLDSSNFLPF